MLADRRDAEEITQDVLMDVVQKIGTFRGDAAFSSWIYRITADAAYERLRSRRARAEEVLDPLLGMFDDAGHHVDRVMDWSELLDDPAAATDARTALERGIERLPDGHRIVLLLRDVEGLTNEAVADALGLSIAAVTSRLHRARLLLRNEIAYTFVPAC